MSIASSLIGLVSSPKKKVICNLLFATTGTLVVSIGFQIHLMTRLYQLESVKPETILTNSQFEQEQLALNEKQDAINRRQLNINKSILRLNDDGDDIFKVIETRLSQLSEHSKQMDKLTADRFALEERINQDVQDSFKAQDQTNKQLLELYGLLSKQISVLSKR